MLQLCEQRRIFCVDEWQQTCVEQRAVQVKDNTSNQLLCNRHFLDEIKLRELLIESKQDEESDGDAPKRASESVVGIQSGSVFAAIALCGTEQENLRSSPESTKSTVVTHDDANTGSVWLFCCITAFSFNLFLSLTKLVIALLHYFFLSPLKK